MFWTILQYIGLGTSFLYLYLEFKQRPSMWIVSASCSAIYASIYAHAQIYGDMSFSLFNICMCVYGFAKWWKKRSNSQELNGSSAETVTPQKKKKEIEYTHFTLMQFLWVTLATAGIYLLLYHILNDFTNSPVPDLDSFTTTLNIVGTWVLAQKIIEVWGYWFLVNLVSIYLYWKRGLHFTTILLYVFYLLASVYGYWKWYRYGKQIDKEN